MLYLNSPQWADLQGAYGSAAGIPKLLRQLKNADPPKNYEEEPWFSLWSALFHQNDVYTASYAAVPHLIADAERRPNKERLEHFHLVSAIEACRHRKNAPSIPSDLEEAYHRALAQASSLILACLENDWDEIGYRILLGGLLILRGKVPMGFAVLDFSAASECPACGKVFPTQGTDIFDA